MDTLWQTMAVAVPVAGAAWQVYAGRQSTHAAEIAQIEGAIETATTRDPVLAKVYRAHAIKRLGDFHGRPSLAGLGAAMWALVSLLILSLVPAATGWLVVILPAASILSLILVATNYGRMELRHQTRDAETRQSLTQALIRARVDLISEVDAATPVEERAPLAAIAAKSIRSWARGNRMFLVVVAIVVAASWFGVERTTDALERGDIGFDQTMSWTAWVVCSAAVAAILLAPKADETIRRLAKGRLRLALRILAPLAVASAALTWLPAPLASFLEQMLLDDPTSTWRDVAFMVVVLHDFALAMLVGSISVRLRSRMSTTGMDVPARP